MGCAHPLKMESTKQTSTLHGNKTSINLATIDLNEKKHDLFFIHLEVVGRCSETQPHVSENFNY